MNVRKIILEEHRRQRDTAFEWGLADCLTWAGDVAALILGRDPIQHIRGRYNSEIGARRVMAQEGWSSMRDVAASLFPEIPVALAQSGDWVSVPNPDGSDGLGVVAGAVIVARTKDSIVLVPILQASAAFRVQ